ncbi:MAG: putative manganese-dependent inorganic diphosphatase [Deltaproteobacteria bacterium]|nr:putative manganese-dependent inorganic diphosphatase [Deltaproteobacteria bacterium]
MRKDAIYVIGHKNPDTDSVASAIGLAALRRAQGAASVVAARAGDLNPQTAFVLERLNIAPPVYLQDVHPRAKDVMTAGVVTAQEETPLLEVMSIMRSEKVRFVPVLDKGRRPIGVVSLMDLARRYVETGETGGARVARTTMENVARTLKAERVLDFTDGADLTIAVYAAAMAEASFDYLITAQGPAECAVVAGDRSDIQLCAARAGVRLLVISGGFEASAEVRASAAKGRTSIVISPFDSATAVGLMHLSTPARRVCSKGFESAAPDELCAELSRRLAGADGADGLLVIDPDGVMLGVVTKTDLLRPTGASLILVDHNELGQAVDGAEDANVIEVVDHHRLGAFSTRHPITFLCEPVGATSTLVAELYRKAGVEMDKGVAGALLAGVISDTVMLKSPTATHRDKEAAGWLSERSGLDLYEFASDIFNATAGLKTRGASHAVNDDFKIFEARGKRFGVGQVEVIGFDEFAEEKSALRSKLDAVREKKALEFAALLVTDIAAGTSLLLAAGEKKVVANLDYPRLEDAVFELKSVISRKKQVVPHLLAVFEKVY